MGPLSGLSLLWRTIVTGSEPRSWVKVNYLSDALFQWVSSDVQFNFPALGAHRFCRGQIWALNVTTWLGSHGLQPD
jgi:hypothetical protein